MSILTVSRSEQPSWEVEYNLATKDKVRRKIQRDVDRFIAAGNKISHIAGTERVFENLDHAAMRYMPTGQGLS